MPNTVRILSLHHALNEEHATLWVQTGGQIVECHINNILSDFLIRHKAEVMDVVLTEYDEAKHMKLIEKEAEARGEAIGQARGQIIGAIKLAQMNPNISDVEIVSSIMELFELPEDEAWEYFRSYK